MLKTDVRVEMVFSVSAMTGSQRDQFHIISFKMDVRVETVFSTSAMMDSQGDQFHSINFKMDVIRETVFSSSAKMDSKRDHLHSNRDMTNSNGSKLLSNRLLLRVPLDRTPCNRAGRFRQDTMAKVMITHTRGRGMGREVLRCPVGFRRTSHIWEKVRVETLPRMVTILGAWEWAWAWYLHLGIATSMHGLSFRLRL